MSSYLKTNETVLLTLFYFTFLLSLILQDAPDFLCLSQRLKIRFIKINQNCLKMNKIWADNTSRISLRNECRKLFKIINQCFKGHPVFNNIIVEWWSFLRFLLTWNFVKNFVFSNFYLKIFKRRKSFRSCTIIVIFRN